jgi:hypothetical protein
MTTSLGPRDEQQEQPAGCQPNGPGDQSRHAVWLRFERADRVEEESARPVTDRLFLSLTLFDLRSYLVILAGGPIRKRREQRRR